MRGLQCMNEHSDSTRRRRRARLSPSAGLRTDDRCMRYGRLPAASYRPSRQTWRVKRRGPTSRAGHRERPGTTHRGRASDKVGRAFWDTFTAADAHSDRSICASRSHVQRAQRRRFWLFFDGRGGVVGARVLCALSGASGVVRPDARAMRLAWRFLERRGKVHPVAWLADDDILRFDGDGYGLGDVAPDRRCDWSRGADAQQGQP